MSLYRIAGVLAGLILCLTACSSSDDSAEPDVDGVADAGSSEPEDPSHDVDDTVRFGSLDELVVALGLSGCEPSDGVVLQITTQPDESLACGDTVEVDWYLDQASFVQARAETENQICSEVDGEWSYLVGVWWTLTAKLPVEPGSDDTALQILAQRGGTGAIETYSC